MRTQVRFGGSSKHPMKKKGKPYFPVHLSQKVFPQEIDFSTLNLKYPLTHDTTFAIERTGWAPPREVMPNLPFHVDRSTTGKHFPVYTFYSGSGTKVQTVVRRMSGDIETLKEELEKVVENAEVVVRPGKLLVRGNYVLRVKRWLLGLGF